MRPREETAAKIASKKLNEETFKNFLREIVLLNLSGNLFRPGRRPGGAE
jgi:hypothetical protein